MYIPAAFAITDLRQQLAFLKQQAFGNFLFIDGEQIQSVHLPFLLIEAETNNLEGHLAIQNPFSKAIFEESSAKCIVTGAHGYVSSSVYTHVNVPTYNYQVAEITGKFKKLNAEAFDLHLRKVVNRFEEGRDPEVDFAAWPKEMIESYKSEIVGFSFEIESIECAFKLSQNRNETDFQRIVADLEKGSLQQQLLASEMKNLKS
jgi:transcriptional regulator